MKLICEEIILLLEENGYEEKSKTFKWFLSSLDLDSLEERKSACRQMLRIYGGMGSFNDIVLSTNGEMMYQENQKLDKLRKELYELLIRSL